MHIVRGLLCVSVSLAIYVYKYYFVGWMDSGQVFTFSQHPTSMNINTTKPQTISGRGRASRPFQFMNSLSEIYFASICRSLFSISSNCISVCFRHASRQRAVARINLLIQNGFEYYKHLPWHTSVEMGLSRPIFVSISCPFSEREREIRVQLYWNYYLFPPFVLDRLCEHGPLG